MKFSQIENAGINSARSANASMVKSRMKNPATGQNWFEAPSPEYQAYEMNRGNQGLKDRQTKFDQDVNLEKRILTELEPMANNEKNRALGMELATRLPYATFEKSADLFGGARTLASAMGTFDTLRYQKGVSMSL